MTDTERDQQIIQAERAVGLWLKIIAAVTSAGMLGIGGALFQLSSTQAVFAVELRYQREELQSLSAAVEGAGADRYTASQARSDLDDLRGRVRANEQSIVELQKDIIRGGGE